jgi:hypothetical protein
MTARARWATLAILLAAAGLSAGCGGGGTGEGTTATARQSTSGLFATEGSGGGIAGTAGSGGPQGGGEDRRPGKAAEGSADEGRPRARQAAKRHARRVARKRIAYDRKRFGVPSKRSAPFAKYSPQSDPQSHLHLAEFGNEAATGERTEVGEVLSAYLAAVKADEWEVACSHLIEEDQAQLRVMGAEDGGGGSCGEGLPKALTTFDRATHPKPDSAPDGVASLRTQRGGLSGEGAGFALFHSEGADYWVGVKREGGVWRLLTISPEEFAK